jgi:hypothetical protein
VVTVVDAKTKHGRRPRGRPMAQCIQAHKSVRPLEAAFLGTKWSQPEARISAGFRQ